ncbi:14586_t:CDS:1, partial [Dentiscutata erythropus]
IGYESVSPSAIGYDLSAIGYESVSPSAIGYDLSAIGYPSAIGYDFLTTGTALIIED